MTAGPDITLVHRLGDFERRRNGRSTSISSPAFWMRAWCNAGPARTKHANKPYQQAGRHAVSGFPRVFQRVKEGRRTYRSGSPVSPTLEVAKAMHKSDVRAGRHIQGTMEPNSRWLPNRTSFVRSCAEWRRAFHPSW